YNDSTPLLRIVLSSFLEFLLPLTSFSSVFFFNDTATPEIYTLSLHDALPILQYQATLNGRRDFSQHFIVSAALAANAGTPKCWLDRKSTRLNSSHDQISYAVFCLKKKKKKKKQTQTNQSIKDTEMLTALPIRT